MNHDSTAALLEASTSISQGAEAASSDSFLLPTVLLEYLVTSLFIVENI